ncbi:DegT/DnrJ/EryC1/StrS family aminotransferase [Propionivibrio sp.]|uniref:DegT/DnrJ/EryC1/StrS family aminotransferase n=1 Tax=Propionivibrio sp. TaxID=2212460 RepID=UPI0025EC8642|nr:DegT/DnrJ/EryC1/StrS family aminotransferase [Propionivibrio sp.]MBK8402055.1 DegT/DnrJ/EryC1/StrS family aminotransferase [Propionivibrio sp.]MBK8743867.1 DegT/DnrJ/EryC1/StrS family aminotransferase [Propionivibrio sp.]MBK8895396.1 DegT/DnrJ/EryC1/StrS family aminotransferase [Propionivibrio sp.]MBL0209041.1 DegT/DnrJ/EryC1/StrS family aminotransferase [Propionivibrio sp.]
MLSASKLPGVEKIDAIRYFSLGRHALVAGLRALGIGVGQSVLLPEYICRDLLAAVHAVGAKPVYYPVGLDLCPATFQENWPTAAAVLVVDYFGFPQPLQCFRDYCNRTGAVIIEDNAHGFLSRDETGILLGFRGDVGVLSLRKTFLFPNGAALVIPNASVVKHMEPQLEFSGMGVGGALRVKGLLHRLPILRPLVVAGAIRLARRVRRLRTGHAIPPPAADAETVIPTTPLPYGGMLRDLTSCDFSAEISRRRMLYDDFSDLLHDWNIRPVFDSLPENVVPYGFPFRADDSLATKVQQLAERRGLDTFRWPDLPDALVSSAPEHYRRTWLLNFLW